MGFSVAPFGIDGESEGIDIWEMQKLSEEWLAVCSHHLELYGESFDINWKGNLAHIGMKFTSAAGAALVTYSVHGRPAASLALVSGSSTAEAEGLKMFVDSLLASKVVQVAATTSDAFQSVFKIKERPLMVVVPFPDSYVADRDHALVRELAIHTAGAFFQRNQAL